MILDDSCSPDCVRVKVLFEGLLPDVLFGCEQDESYACLMHDDGLKILRWLFGSRREPLEGVSAL